MESQNNNYLPTPVKGVPEVKPVLDHDFAAKILKNAARMTEWHGGGFPGSVMAPLRNENLKFLVQEDYAVSFKADGTRYMMWIDGPGPAYLINRNAEVFSTVLPMIFPFNKGDKGHLFGTLLDGEMINYWDFKTSSKPMTYLIFDVISINGVSVAAQPFHKRFEIAQDIVLTRLKASDEQYKILREPFHVGNVNFCCLTSWSLSMLPKKCSGYESDGLVLIPINRAYNFWPTRPGVCDYSLKWKPASLNTVDFLLKMDENQNSSIGNLYVTTKDGTEVQFDTIELTSELKCLNNTIIECKKVDGKWILLRTRSDRRIPNPLVTAKDTVSSIENAISEKQLLEFIANRTDSETHSCSLCEGFRNMWCR